MRAPQRKRLPLCATNGPRTGGTAAWSERPKRLQDSVNPVLRIWDCPEAINLAPTTDMGTLWSGCSITYKRSAADSQLWPLKRNVLISTSQVLVRADNLLFF